MLILKNSKKLLVTQSNQLVEARYNLKVGEQRFVLLMISMIEPKDEDFKDYEIKIMDFLRLLDLTGKDNYQRVKDITASLVSKVIKIKNEKGFLQVSWLSSAQYVENMGIVKLSFDPKLKPHLLQLKSHFTKYHLSIAIRFRSLYTIRIYTLLKSNQYKGHVDFYYQDLRNLLGINESEYKEYKQFRQWILNQTKKELEEKDEKGGYKSDVSFELEVLERRNRKIYRIRLHIIEHKTQTPLPLTLEVNNPKPVKENNPVIEKLIYYGIAIKQAKTLLKKHKETIQGSIELFEKDLNDNKIKKNKSGYLITLITSNAGIQSQYEKNKQEDSRNKIEQEERKKQKERKKMAKFKDKTIKLFAIIEKIEFGILKDKIKEIIVCSPFANNKTATSMEINMVDGLTNFDALTTVFTPDTDRPLSKYILQILQNEYLPE